MKTKLFFILFLLVVVTSCEKEMHTTKNIRGTWILKSYKNIVHEVEWNHDPLNVRIIETQSERILQDSAGLFIKSTYTYDQNWNLLDSQSDSLYEVYSFQISLKDELIPNHEKKAYYAYYIDNISEGEQTSEWMWDGIHKQKIYLPMYYTGESIRIDYLTDNKLKLYEKQEKGNREKILEKDEDYSYEKIEVLYERID